MAKELFIFSGLGADERVFQKLDFSGYTTTFIKWIAVKDKETIEDYAQRLCQQISSEKPILIGLSFGGIMAAEIAKQIDCELVIFISSAKTKKEIPFYYRLFGWLRLHRLIPTSFLKTANFMTNWAFGVHSKFDKALLKQILEDSDPAFLRWAIDQVLRWKNKRLPQNFIHIHGTGDKILPIFFVNSDIKIKNGGHFMVLNMATMLTEILRKSLVTLKS